MPLEKKIISKLVLLNFLFDLFGYPEVILEIEGSFWKRCKKALLKNVPIKNYQRAPLI